MKAKAGSAIVHPPCSGRAVVQQQQQLLFKHDDDSFGSMGILKYDWLKMRVFAKSLAGSSLGHGRMLLSDKSFCKVLSVLGIFQSKSTTTHARPT